MTTTEWTANENELARCLINGDLLDVSDRSDDSKNVRSEVIRDLLLGRWPDGISNATKPDPRGLRLRGARITHRLDLDYLSADIGLDLINCAIYDGITAMQGRLARLDLTGSTLGRPKGNQPALNGAGLVVIGDLFLAGVRAYSRSTAGTIHLISTRIGGHLRLHNATLTNETGSALDAGRMTVDNHAVCW